MLTESANTLTLAELAFLSYKKLIPIMGSSKAFHEAIFEVVTIHNTHTLNGDYGAPWAYVFPDGSAVIAKTDDDREEENLTLSDEFHESACRCIGCIPIEQLEKELRALQSLENVLTGNRFCRIRPVIEELSGDIEHRRSWDRRQAESEEEAEQASS